MPTQDDIKDMRLTSSEEAHVRGRLRVLEKDIGAQGRGLAEKFHVSVRDKLQTSGAMDLLKNMLRFSTAQRMTIKQALGSTILKEQRRELIGNEQIAPAPFKLAFDDI